MRRHNVEIIPMPLNHAYGLRRYQSDMVNGGTVCLMDGMVFVGTLWKLMEKYQASSMALSPASLGMIFKLSGDRIADYESRLDYIQIGSAPLVEADKQHLLSLMPNTRLYNFYAPPRQAAPAFWILTVRMTSRAVLGRPTVNSVIRFTDENGNTVRPEDVSEEKPALLSWGGDIVMEGYYNDPEMTKETLDSGYVRTKDLAYLDAEGRCILDSGRYGRYHQLWRQQDLTSRGGRLCERLYGDHRLRIQRKAGSDHGRSTGHACHSGRELRRTGIDGVFVRQRLVSLISCPNRFMRLRYCPKPLKALY